MPTPRFTWPPPSGKIQPYPDSSSPRSPRSSRWEEIHSSSRLVSRYSGPPPRTRCRGARSGRAADRRGSGHRRPRPTAGNAPSRVSAADLEHDPATPGRRPGRRRSPARPTTASRRRPAPGRGSCRPARFAGPPSRDPGSDPPGHGSSQTEPKPCARSPRLTTCERVHSPSPSRSSSAIARGVSPSPQVLSRGKAAASASVTWRPERAAQAAADAPAGPAPTTRTSVSASVDPVTRRHPRRRLFHRCGQLRISHRDRCVIQGVSPSGQRFRLGRPVLGRARRSAAMVVEWSADLVNEFTSDAGSGPKPGRSRPPGETHDGQLAAPRGSVDGLVGA